MIEPGENGDLDGARRGKNLVSVKEILLAGGKVQNGHAKHTVEVAINLIDSRFQLLPKNLLFLRRGLLGTGRDWMADRKSTRLNSSHSQISYAVFCLKKKKKLIEKLLVLTSMKWIPREESDAYYIFRIRPQLLGSASADHVVKSTVSYVHYVSVTAI